MNLLHISRIGWKKVSQYQKLSESFIREMEDYVWWIRVYKYQNISDEFRKEIEKMIK